MTQWYGLIPLGKAEDAINESIDHLANALYEPRPNDPFWHGPSVNQREAIKDWLDALRTIREEMAVPELDRLADAS